MSATSHRNRAYCPHCDDTVLVTLMNAGPTGTVEACNRCDSLELYDSRQDWADGERQRVERMIQCGESPKPAISDDYTGHCFEERSHPSSQAGRCDFCGLPEGMTPEDTLPEGVEMTDSEG